MSEEKMKNYEQLLQHKELNFLLDTINEKNKNTLLLCHGRHHVINVVNRISYILETLNESSKIIELGKIAGLLHDIGCIEGKENHTLRSTKMSAKYLETLDLTEPEKKLILDAIRDHSKGENINSSIGAALIFADKTDSGKDRVLEFGKRNNYYLLGIEDVEFKIEQKNFILNYIVNEKFSEEIFKKESSKQIALSYKTAHYLGFELIIKINNKPI